MLFVCIGNSCRSQMAEAFARTYGSDVIIASSAGLSPALILSPMTRIVLEDKNIATDDHFPKTIEMATRDRQDIVVNMSGSPITVDAERIVDWTLQDPIGQDLLVFQRIATQIEELVMRLILELRMSAK